MARITSCYVSSALVLTAPCNNTGRGASLSRGSGGFTATSIVNRCLRPGQPERASGAGAGLVAAAEPLS